jgi:Spy/CpxP family protein refolding chaperone
MSVTSTLPLMAWGPGSVTATPAVMGRLFPPTLIMQRQHELALTDQQQEIIKAELREFQSQVVDVQWDLQSSQGALESLLAEDRIDADAAAGAIDRVLAAENALKKLHLTLLIRIRNVLDPEQITTLEGSFRSHRGWVMPLAPQPPPTP